MKKRILIITIVLFCGANFYAQTLNSEIREEEQAAFLLGKINRDGLQLENYSIWFSENYENYIVDNAVVDSLKQVAHDISISVFLGTWCGDSRREVPRFFKILDAMNFPENQVQAFALSAKSDVYKKSPDKDEKGLNIHRVPTFIIYRNGVEVNRIIEYPVESLEKDLLAICKETVYEPNYLIVEKVHTFLEKEGVEEFNKKLHLLANDLKNFSNKNSELNTYARILFSDEKIQEAISVLQLNVLLFPDNPANFQWIGYYYLLLEDKKSAIENYEKALHLDPENRDLKNTLKVLRE